MTVKQSVAWQALEAHLQKDIAPYSLKQLFNNAGARRFEDLSVATDGLLLDFSKQKLTPDTFSLLIDLAQQQGLGEATNALYSGGKVNRSEMRPALHTALRATPSDQSGDIQIDGQSIYKSTIDSLRKNISLVSQDTTLFDDTIRNNIAYANLNATQKEIEEVSKHSYASEFIEKLPNKYETIIGENGTRLSGGEKQRLSIARAMLKKSQIILLDEATSSLDAETENKIQEAINFLTKNRTTIVIAHRLSTILNSDNIYVIESGRVAGEGTHDELLIKSPVYKNFYEKQIRKT